MLGKSSFKVKICCIKSIEEAKLAIEFGASAIGLVSHMPSGPGMIGDDLIKEIAITIPQNISSFVLTSRSSTEGVIGQLKQFSPTTIQIVDKIVEGKYEDIRREIPDVDIVQVIHVIDDQSIEEAIRISKFVDFILLDSGNPNLKVKEFGGTGRVHNWDISKTINQEVDVPVYLAGGLNSENVESAISHVQPYGVDVCSGVRTNGELDTEKLKAFMQAVQTSQN